MTGIGWQLVDGVSQLLPPAEREFVRGDLEEGGAGAWQALRSVTGLVMRRQLELWLSWRPWVAAFGVGLPASFLLMGVSLSVSRAWLAAAGGEGWLAPAWRAGLLVGWAWSAGFVAGAVSRRTVWVTAGCCFIACSFCVAEFRVPGLSWPCLLLFLPAAIWGVHSGRRATGFSIWKAGALALSVTLLTIPIASARGARLNWFLSWPAWYIAATAGKRAKV